MKIVSFLLALSCCAALSTSAEELRQPLDKPNVIIVYLDDAGFSDFAFNGNPGIKTPRVDKLAAEGMQLTSFYAGSPACSASRYALMTGKSPARFRFERWVLNPDDGEFLRPEEQSLAELFKAVGYRTAAIGKWHLGFPNKKNGYDPRSLPLAHGFESWVGIPYSNDMKPSLLLRQPGKSEQYETAQIVESPVREDTLTQRYFDEACEFVRTHKDAPFFLYVAPAMPHHPVSASPPFVGKSATGRLYDDVIEEIDFYMGKLVDAVHESGIAANTLIIFSSDNGPWLMKEEQAGRALPYRDGKMSCFEGGIRVPGVFYWPGTIPAGKDNSVTSVVDLLPSMAELTGQVPRPWGTLDGRSILGKLNPSRWTSPPDDDDYSIVMTGAGRNIPMAVRWKNWKLHLKTFSQLWQENAAFPHNSPYVEASDEHPLLYDLDSDVAETTNIADKHPEVVERMKKDFRRFTDSVEYEWERNK